MTIATRLLAFLLLTAAHALFAQSFEAGMHPDPVDDLAQATWRFHPGDDARWADPGFDDSAWPLLKGSQSWDSQGYKQLSGIAWYRLRVKVPKGKPLLLAPGGIRDSYEVFANGSKLGSWGSLTPGSFPLNTHDLSSLIVSLPSDSGETVLAIRVWHWPVWAHYYGGGMQGTPILLGEPVAVNNLIEARRDKVFVFTGAANFVAVLSVLAGILVLILYRSERSSTEYVWFGILALCSGIPQLLLFASTRWIMLDINLRDIAIAGLVGLRRISLVLFFFYFVARPVPRWVRWFLWAQLPLFAVEAVASYTRFISVSASIIDQTTCDLIAYGIVLALLPGLWKTSRPARRLTAPLLNLTLIDTISGVSWALFAAGVSTWTLPPMATHPFRLEFDDFAQFLFLIVMARVLIWRFAETQSERTLLTGELAAAREIQQVLVPASESSIEGIAPVPGYTMQSAYQPAQQVGGDFFQIIPMADGASSLIVLGDVSGKGLQAAMTVSLLVGALRAAVEERTDPADLLHVLNRCLYGRGMGFTTCLILHIQPSGEVIAANAGHLQPYLSGREFNLGAGLPLGFTVETEYETTRFQLQPGDSLTLLTDGVVEAMSPAKELFGFARTEAISAQAAGSIAEAARLFGKGAPQADDITVLTLVREGLPAAALA